MLGRAGDSDGCQYLCDEEVECKGIRVYGTPYSKAADHGSPSNAFQGEGEGHYPIEYASGPGTILVTHGPPMRIRMEEEFRLPRLAQSLAQAPPQVLVCGHLHRTHGCYIHKQTLVVNASSVNANLSPTNPPIVFDIRPTDTLMNTGPTGPRVS